MSQSATIKSLPRAFRMLKAMQAQGITTGNRRVNPSRASTSSIFSRGALVTSVVATPVAAAQSRNAMTPAVGSSSQRDSRNNRSFVHT